MTSFGPLQSSGGVATSNFDFTYLSIHASETGKTSGNSDSGKNSEAIENGEIWKPSETNELGKNN